MRVCVAALMDRAKRLVSRTTFGWTLRNWCSIYLSTFVVMQLVGVETICRWRTSILGAIQICLDRRISRIAAENREEVDFLAL